MKEKKFIAVTSFTSLGFEFGIGWPCRLEVRQVGYLQGLEFQ